MKKNDRTISFRHDMIDLILAGKKTVTIRPITILPGNGAGFVPGNSGGVIKRR